jgi:hypothetical protein
MKPHLVESAAELDTARLLTISDLPKKSKHGMDFLQKPKTRFRQQSAWPGPAMEIHSKTVQDAGRQTIRCKIKKSPLLLAGLLE